MEVNPDLIVMVKINTKVSFKDTTENLTKDGLGGSYLVSRNRPMVPGGRPLITIGCKYNAQKVLYLLLQTTHGAHMQIFHIYLSTLTIFITFPFALFLTPLSYIRS